MSAGLTEAERKLLAEYAEDAMIFSAGASAEHLLGVRSDGPREWAAEFVLARIPVEFESLLAERVAQAKAEAWDEGYAEGRNEAYAEQHGHDYTADNPYRGARS